MVMRLAKKLKGTAFAIDRDYPAEISAARKKLWPEVKKLRSGPNVNVQLKFPAKIVYNGQVVRDEFPSWDQLLKSVVANDFRYITQEENALRLQASQPTQTLTHVSSGDQHRTGTIKQLQFQAPRVDLMIPIHLLYLKMCISLK